MSPAKPESKGALLGLTREELEGLVCACGQPRYRGRQIYDALYARRERDFHAFTNLSRSFRAQLVERHTLGYPLVRGSFVSRDDSARYLLEFGEGSVVETVYMPEEDRVTLCVSSQVGCAVDCRFCFTALLGLERNLTAGEMVGQVLAVMAAQSIPRPSRVNVVFMGMGEPLLNYAPVMKAVRLLSDPEGLAIPLRRITVSTAGIVPRIRDLGREPQRPKLAVSLNASTDEQRTAIMPLNRKYPLHEMIAACRAFPLRPRERLTFEYVLLEGVNDADADAYRVAELLHGLRAKVNLIPYNSGAELPYRPPPFERVLGFQQILAEHGVPAFIRISRGQDIRGACGQLSLAGVKHAAATSC